jgi:DNA adenine methylase
MRFLSPLRYPGGKAKLGPFFYELIEKNELQDFEYAEAYAGGAGVALDLLTNRYVSAIHLNDLSYPIYSFWYSILKNTDEFCERIKNISLTIEEWNIQKEMITNAESYDIFDVGFAAFYLNRTNRSGILSGGVIGGKSQEGKWKLNARFNRENLIKRIRLISLFKSKIHIYNLDAIEFLNERIKDLSNDVLIYLDPPYYEKGRELYDNHYLHDDHLEIAEVVKNLEEKLWVISYDNTKPIRDIYSEHDKLTYNLNYSAQKKYLGSEVIIIDPKLEHPDYEQIKVIKNPNILRSIY